MIAESEDRVPLRRGITRSRDATRATEEMDAVDATSPTSMVTASLPARVTPGVRSNDPVGREFGAAAYSSCLIRYSGRALISSNSCAR
jgi:hypothetical protein